MNDTTSSEVWTVAGVLLAIQVANFYVNVCAKLGVSVMALPRRAASALLRPLRALRGLCDRIRRAFHGHGCPCCKVVVGKDFVIAPKWCRVEREDDCGKEARGMSALIKCEILGGTDIGEAYDDCRRIGRATGTCVECVFNGVAMFWSRHTTKDDWIAAFYRKIGRDSSSSSSARPGSGRRPRESRSLTRRMEGGRGMNPDAIVGIVFLLLSIALLVSSVAFAWFVYEDMRTGSKALEEIVTIGVDHDGRATGVICPECVDVRFTHSESPVSLAKMAERKEAAG